MSLAAVLVASSLSQLSTVTEIRYSSRGSTARDHVMITWSQRTPAHHPCDEFWHATGLPVPLLPVREGRDHGHGQRYQRGDLDGEAGHHRAGAVT
jgi:hypothetical protein